MDANSPLPAARWINEVNTAYCRSKVLHSAVEVGVFPLLADGPATAGQIIESLGLHPDLAHDFLDVLAALGFLERADGTYRNTAATTLLLPGGEVYLGGSVTSHGRIHYDAWGRLTDALHDGAAKSGAVAGPDAFARTYGDPKHLRRFMAHMDAFNFFVNHELARHIEWDRYTSFVDVGGARGNTAAHLVCAHPHLRGTVLDLPAVEPLFTEHMAAHGTTGAVTFQAGDFHHDPPVPADVALLVHVLHDWPVADRRRLVTRACEAVLPGGTVVIVDALLDEDRADPDALVQSLRCRLIRDGGSEYTVSDCEDWLRACGFRVHRVRRVETVTRDAVVVAVRDS
ncbi:methyltransferase [Streptomyces iconiensis]|uniref:Methyltransferase n=1 Tax=Streptomyces iconiensis TaxID=1384038 RepID=A0ABT7A798_9ACTN|nr:methyltransferase [Streptomyces iconiensis]MDJ1136884.1 methyltransferase [Streptomyces iconiensis]